MKPADEKEMECWFGVSSLCQSYGAEYVLRQLADYADKHAVEFSAEVLAALNPPE